MTLTATETRPHVESRVPRAVPGEIAVWVFVLGDMLMFGTFFGVFVHDRASHPAMYHESQAHLQVAFGALNTLLLLTGSWFVVLGVRAVRGNQRLAGRLFALAWLCGLGFAVNKVFEYGQKFAAGITPETNSFYTYYFLFTGIHALHLLIGLCVLGYLWRITRTPGLQPRHFRNIENGATYWHLVDLLWVVLFALLYLIN